MKTLPLSIESNASLDDVVARVTQETLEMWLSKRSDYSFSDSGFAVMLSPARNGGLVCIGANPGGGPSAFDVRKASTPPNAHDWFVYDYPLARKMRAHFRTLGKEEVLRQSTCLNLNFFRSADDAEWKSAPLALRRELEAFSAARVDVLLNAIQPKAVLALGFKTYDSLCTRLGRQAKVDATPVCAADGRRLICSAELGDYTIVGMIHPTGAQVNATDQRRIVKQLAQYI